MEKFLANLKIQAENNPIVAIGVGIAALHAVRQFIDTAGEAYGRRTWSKEVNRRARTAKKVV